MASPKKRQLKRKTVQSPRAIHKKEPDPDDWLYDEEPFMTTTKKDDDDKDEKENKSAKGETRLFQTSADPSKKEALTKAQAKEKGFFWKEESDDK